MKRCVTAKRQLQIEHLQSAPRSSRSFFTRLVAVGLVSSIPLLAGLSFSSALAEEQQPPKIAAVRVGLADCYKLGLWTQVEIMLIGGSEALTGEVAVITSDSDGVPTRVSTPCFRPCQVMPGRETRLCLVTRFGRADGSLSVEFRGASGVLARRTFTTAPRADSDHFLRALESQKLLVAVGPTSLGMEELGKLQGLESEDRPVVVRLDNVGQLPLEWTAYEGVEAVVLSTSELEIFRGLSDDTERLRALEKWVQGGGRLVFLVGQHGREVLAQESLLRRFAPGPFEKMVPLHYTNALESYSGGTVPVTQTTGAQVNLRVPKLAVAQGIQAHEADLPLVVRTAQGFGQVLFVAADLDQPPLSQWSDRPLFLAKLLDMPSGHSADSEESAAMLHYGFNDLAGQLRSALDQFAGVGMASFSLVAGLIILYVLLIGPGDYFFLAKVVRRMTGTWLTFPLIVALASAGTYYLACYLRGSHCRLNQLDLVDVDVSSGNVRGATWANVFSPELKTFDFSLQPRLPNGAAPSDAQISLAWFGLPGGALGGMSARTSGLSSWTQPYDFSPSLDAIRRIPIQVGATKSLTCRWYASTDAFPRVSLTDEGTQLLGSLVNTLDFPLEQCILVYGRSVYEVGAIAPGKSVRIDAMLKRSELKTLLAGWKMVLVQSGDKYRRESTPYDQSSTDLLYVLRMMMFHDAAGGSRYTGLSNEYQSFVDFSNLLKTDRAVLVAHGPAGANASDYGAQLVADGEPLDDPQDKHVTVYRFVYPVKARKGG